MTLMCPADDDRIMISEFLNVSPLREANIDGQLREVLPQVVFAQVLLR